MDATTAPPSDFSRFLERRKRVRPFRWDSRKELAVQCVAEGRDTEEQIATKVGVTSRTIRNWKRRPEFKDRQRALAQERWAVASRVSIGKRLYRVRALQEQYNAAREVVAARAADPAMADVPGGKTGLVVRAVKRVGEGEAARDVELLEVDVALLAEMRETLAQAADELGHWEQMAASVVEAGATITPDAIGVNKSEQPQAFQAAVAQLAATDDLTGPGN